jgi:predicted DNA-binding protein (MmcQ/YjbR family)
MPAKSNEARKADKELARYALGFPEVHEDFPWGERAVKVRKKVFVFMRCDEDGLSVGVKLPQSQGAAMTYKFAEPSAYGLGKHGWITASFKPNGKIPIDLLKKWIAESYRAVAPKTLAAKLPSK